MLIKKKIELSIFGDTLISPILARAQAGFHPGAHNHDAPLLIRPFHDSDTRYMVYGPPAGRRNTATTAAPGMRPRRMMGVMVMVMVEGGRAPPTDHTIQPPGGGHHPPLTMIIPHPS